MVCARRGPVNEIQLRRANKMGTGPTIELRTKASRFGANALPAFKSMTAGLVKKLSPQPTELHFV
jgi:hypothetical protein